MTEPERNKTDAVRNAAVFAAGGDISTAESDDNIAKNAELRAIEAVLTGHLHVELERLRWEAAPETGLVKLSHDRKTGTPLAANWLDGYSNIADAYSATGTYGEDTVNYFIPQLREFLENNHARAVDRAAKLTDELPPRMGIERFDYDSNPNVGTGRDYQYDPASKKWRQTSASWMLDNIAAGFRFEPRFHADTAAIVHQLVLQVDPLISRERFEQVLAESFRTLIAPPARLTQRQLGPFLRALSMPLAQEGRPAETALTVKPHIDNYIIDPKTLKVRYRYKDIKDFSVGITSSTEIDGRQLTYGDVVRISDYKGDSRGLSMNEACAAMIPTAKGETPVLRARWEEKVATWAPAHAIELPERRMARSIEDIPADVRAAMAGVQRGIELSIDSIGFPVRVRRTYKSGPIAASDNSVPTFDSNRDDLLITAVDGKLRVTASSPALPGDYLIVRVPGPYSVESANTPLLHVTGAQYVYDDVPTGGRHLIETTQASIHAASNSATQLLSTQSWAVEADWGQPDAAGLVLPPSVQVGQNEETSGRVGGNAAAFVSVSTAKRYSRLEVMPVQEPQAVPLDQALQQTITWQSEAKAMGAYATRQGSLEWYPYVHSGTLDGYRRWVAAYPDQAENAIDHFRKVRHDVQATFSDERTRTLGELLRKAMIADDHAAARLVLQDDYDYEESPTKRFLAWVVSMEPMPERLDQSEAVAASRVFNGIAQRAVQAQVAQVLADLAGRHPMLAAEIDQTIAGTQLASLVTAARFESHVRSGLQVSLPEDNGRHFIQSQMLSQAKVPAPATVGRAMAGLPIAASASELVSDKDAIQEFASISGRQIVHLGWMTGRWLGHRENESLKSTQWANYDEFARTHIAQMLQEMGIESLPSETMKQFRYGVTSGIYRVVQPIHADRIKPDRQLAKAEKPPIDRRTLLASSQIFEQLRHLDRAAIEASNHRARSLIRKEAEGRSPAPEREQVKPSITGRPVDAGRDESAHSKQPPRKARPSRSDRQNPQPPTAKLDTTPQRALPQVNRNTPDRPAIRPSGKSVEQAPNDSAPPRVMPQSGRQSPQPKLPTAPPVPPLRGPEPPMPPLPQLPSGPSSLR